MNLLLAPLRPLADLLDLAAEVAVALGTVSVGLLLVTHESAAGPAAPTASRAGVSPVRAAGR